jgi:hypothetical protein
MRAFAVMIASTAIILAITSSARAQSHARKPCATTVCLLNRIGTLETEVADLTKQLSNLSSIVIKSGQAVILNAPSGCLSYSDPSDTSSGPVWWSHPCKNGSWTIQ